MGSQEICSDIVFEILTRTKSLTTLDTCKSVCKEWNQMIYESSFMPTYCKRTQNLSGFFLQDMKNNEYSSMFVTVDNPSDEEHRRHDLCMANVRILASCNQGILCCVKRYGYNHRYYACKPATKQWQSLPNPKLRYATAAVAIAVLKSSPLRYKIIRLSNEGFMRSTNTMYKYRCEIFDSQVWRWREAQPLILPYSELITNSNPCVCCGGSFHWLTTEDNVLRFDQVRECFNRFPLPKPVHNNNSYTNKNLCDYQGRLGLTCLTQEGNMELWAVENGPIKAGIEWRKKVVVNLEKLERDVTYPSPTSFYNADIALLKAFREVVFYKLQDRSFSKVGLRNGMREATEVFQFRSDLEPVTLKNMEFGGKIRPLKIKCFQGPKISIKYSRRIKFSVPSLIFVGVAIVLVIWNLI